MLWDMFKIILLKSEKIEIVDLGKIIHICNSLTQLRHSKGGDGSIIKPPFLRSAMNKERHLYFGMKHVDARDAAASFFFEISG